MATEQQINLTNLIAGAVQVLGHQHPAVILADAALHYKSTEAHNARAMDEAHRNLQDLLDHITAPLPRFLGGPWHTQGEARIGNGETDSDCVVMVGTRQILECYEDGEVQKEEDQANARRVVKTWNAYQKLVDALRKLVAQAMPDPDKATGAHVNAAQLLRDLGEAE